VTGLPGPGPDGSLTEQEQSLVGRARWPGADPSIEGDPKQQAYGRLFRSATRDAGTQLAQGGIPSLRALWTYAQDWRGSTVSDRDSRDFGLGSERRDHGVGSRDMTPLVGSYAYISDRCKQRSDGTLEYPERNSKRYSIRDDIDGKTIALTSVSIRTVWGETSASDYMAANRRGEHWPPGGPPPFRINHTSVANAQRIMDHAESLFSRVLNPRLPQANALATLGELHWWLAHAMPDVRGSAAKAELCVRSLAQARGMDLPPFKPGFVPDLEAMIRPRPDYVAGYASSFSRPPQV
jgi:avirulence protein